MRSRLAFKKPLIHASISRPPEGGDWLHEPKWYGLRFQIVKYSGDVRLYSKHGAEYSVRLPHMVEGRAKIPARSVIIDGELCLIDPRGSAHFWKLIAQMRTSQPEESEPMFLAFDLLHLDSIDLRSLAREVQMFPNGALLLHHCNRFGFEGLS